MKLEELKHRAKLSPSGDSFTQIKMTKVSPSFHEFDAFLFELLKAKSETKQTTRKTC